MADPVLDNPLPDDLISRLIRSIPSGSTARIAGDYGQNVYALAKNLQMLAASGSMATGLSAAGLPGNILDNTKTIAQYKPSFMDAQKLIPRKFDASQIPTALPGLVKALGLKQPTSEQAKSFTDMMYNAGVPQALHPIFQAILQGGKKTKLLPTLDFSDPTPTIQNTNPPEAVVPMGTTNYTGVAPESVRNTPAATMSEPVLRGGDILSALGKKFSQVGIMTNPLIRTATALGTSVTGGNPLKAVEPHSIMDVLAPVAGFGADVATHPLSTVGRGAGLLKLATGVASKLPGTASISDLLSYMKDARKMSPWTPDVSAAGANIGQDLGEAAAEVGAHSVGTLTGMLAHPVITAKAVGDVLKTGKLEGALSGIDPEYWQSLFRKPSSLVRPEVMDAIQGAARDIGLNQRKVDARTAKWMAITDPELRTEIGKSVMSGDYSTLSGDAVNIAKGLRRADVIGGLQAVKGGVLDPAIFEQMRKTHVPYLYQYFQDNPTFMKALMTASQEGKLSGEAANTASDILGIKGVDQGVADLKAAGVNISERLQGAPTTSPMRAATKYFEQRGKAFEPKMSDLVGSSTEAKLKSLGYTHPAQIANASPAELSKIMDGLGPNLEFTKAPAEPIGFGESLTSGGSQAKLRQDYLGEKLQNDAGYLITQKAQDYETWRKAMGQWGPERIGQAINIGAKRSFASGRYGEMYQDLLPHSLEKMPDEVMAAQPYIKRVKVSQFLDRPIVEHNGQQWMQMSDNKSFGALAGRWMPRNEAQYIMGMQTAVNPVMKTLSDFNTFFKTMKVPFSPAAQMRNFLISNPLLMQFNGIPLDQAYGKIFERAKMALNGEKDEITRAYLKYGGESSTFGTSEMAALKPNYIKGTMPSVWKQGLRTAYNLPSKGYSRFEQIGKEAIMSYYHDQGLSYKEAFGKAESILFNYGDKPPFVDFISKNGILPFFTFTAKALPSVLKSTLTKPQSVFPIITFRDTWNNMMAKKIGLGPKELGYLKDKYGDWYMLTGGNKQSPEVSDLSFNIPGNEVLDANRNPSQGILTGMAPQAMQPSSWMTGAVVEPIMNKNLYFGTPITRPTDPNIADIPDMIKNWKADGTFSLSKLKTAIGMTKEYKNAKHIGQVFAPNSAFFPGTPSNARLANAMNDMPITSKGKRQSKAQILLGEFGQKTMPFDIQSETGARVRAMKGDLKSLVSALVFVAQNQMLSDSEKKSKMEIIRDQIKEAMKRNAAKVKGE